MKLTPDTPPQNATVVIAMSGGVDSSVAAALMVERGFNCIGIMMRLWSEVKEGESSTNKCCSHESVADARKVAEQLGIPFYLVNAEQPFKKKVVDLFIDGYTRGLTPNPCLACNRHIRFDFLLNYARKLGADYLVTGHHARVKTLADGTVQLMKAVDEGKDQSYVLSVLSQAELRDVLFPVGDYQKAEIREMAAHLDLPVASKNDSMDLCFISDNDYRRFLRDWSAQAMQSGPIIDRKGSTLGEHSGLSNYTIGQRRGLGIRSSGSPMYVVELDMDTNSLVVGSKEELAQRRLIARQVNWTGGQPVPNGTVVECKIRYTGRPSQCKLYTKTAMDENDCPLNESDVQVIFEEPVTGISPGQGAVFYDGDICLGGGIIGK